MKTTTNYGLNKPEGTDYINIEDLNINADKIDTELKTNADNIASVSSQMAEKANLTDVTKTQIGLENVDNVKQMPISGGTFTGISVAQNNANYATKQLRNITLSTTDPVGGSNGDIWIKYTP